MNSAQHPSVKHRFRYYGIESEAVKEAIESYNGKKPYMSLGYRTSDEVYYGRS